MLIWVRGILMKSIVSGFAATALMIAAAGPTFADTVAPGIYEIKDAQTHGDIGHGLYLNGFIVPDMGYNSRRWSIQSGTATVAADGSMDFSAVVKNVWAEDNLGVDLRLELDVSLAALQGPGPVDPTCQNNACAGFGAVNDYLYFESSVGDGFLGSLTGLGDLAGWTGGMTIYPTDLSKPPQLGIGGSWFNALLNLTSDGFATWLEWTLAPPVDVCVECEFLLADVQYDMEYGYSGSGDINWLLGEPVNEIPLPAAGWLLIAGLGGLVAAKRRKS